MGITDTTENIFVKTFILFKRFNKNTEGLRNE